MLFPEGRNWVKVKGIKDPKDTQKYYCVSFIYIQNSNSVDSSSPKTPKFNWLWVEDDFPTLAFPTHGLVVGVVIASCICNTWGCGKVSVPILYLGIRRDLNCLTVPTCAAPSLTPRRPWSYLSTQNCLIFSYRLVKEANNNISHYFPLPQSFFYKKNSESNSHLGKWFG